MRISGGSSDVCSSDLLVAASGEVDRLRCLLGAEVLQGPLCGGQFALEVLCPPGGGDRLGAELFDLGGEGRGGRLQRLGGGGVLGQDRQTAGSGKRAPVVYIPVGTV